MKTESKKVRLQSADISQDETGAVASTAFNYPISQLKLARLNFGLFGSLFNMGTSKERICSALLISASEFDYIRELGGFRRAN